MVQSAAGLASATLIRHLWLRSAQSALWVVGTRSDDAETNLSSEGLKPTGTMFNVSLETTSERVVSAAGCQMFTSNHLVTSFKSSKCVSTSRHEINRYVMNPNQEPR